MNAEPLYKKPYACIFNSAPDEAGLLAETGGRLIPIRKANIEPNFWIDDDDLKRHRKVRETVTCAQHCRTGPQTPCFPDSALIGINAN